MKFRITDTDGKAQLLSENEFWLGTHAKWNTEVKDGVTVARITAGCSQKGFSAREGIVFRPDIDWTDVEYMGIESHCDYWCRPFFGTDPRQMPSRVILLLLRRGEKYQCYLTASDDTFQTLIRSGEEGMEFLTYSNCDGLRVCDNQLAYVYAEGKDPHAIIRLCAETVARELGNGLRMREERVVSDVFEYLGWCSWDAFHIHVTHEGLLEKVKEFREKNVPIHYAIIDDMWADVPNLNKIPKDRPLIEMCRDMHASPMRSFEGDPIRFPKGMEAAISDMKEGGIPHVGIWFPTTGYWLGVTEDGELAKEYGDCLAYGDGDDQKRYVVKPDLKSAFALYHGLCKKVASWGADFVKIDNQGLHRTNYYNIKPIGQSARALHAAIDSATASVFGGALINCMGMPSECMYNRPISAISRCSDDFIPEDYAWFAKNILECAYNGLLQGQYYVNDWDMWWTDDAQAKKNSLCHAISGGPIYVSDQMGRTRPEVLLPLAFADGRLMRPDNSAMPTRDCLTADPTKSERIFKLRNRVGEAGLVAAFHINTERPTVSGTVSPMDAGLTGDCAYYEYFTGACGVLKAGEEISLTLENMDECRLYTFVPLHPSGITLLGRLDKYIGIKAITGRVMNVVTLYEGGKVGFVAPEGTRVYSERRELPVEQSGVLSFVIADKDECVLRFESK